MDTANLGVDLYFEWDIQHGKFMWAAPMFNFLGYNIRHFKPSEEWWTSRIHPNDLDRVMSVLTEMIEEEIHTCSTVFRFLHCKGGYIFVLFKCFVEDRNGGIVLNGSIFTLPHEMDSVLDTMEINIEEHKLFASIVSHEIKEPVRTIEAYYRLFARSLDMDAISSEQKELMMYVEKAIRKLKLLSTGLGQYGSASLYIPKLESLDFGELVKDLLISHKRKIVSRKVEVVYDGQIGEVLLDKFLVGIILQNLLLNAIKYNHSECPTVTIHARYSGTDVVISVTDNGMGIEEQYQKLIFEPFHRIHPNKGAKGSGLGLYAARRAAEKLNGHIRCYSEVGVGSTFEVWLIAKDCGPFPVNN